MTYGEQALARRARVRELMAQRTRLDREIVRLQREANGFESLALVERQTSAHRLPPPNLRTVDANDDPIIARPAPSLPE
ncbi:MAG: hypothetical protein KIS66_02485 [Fimbriimonadaceae bacterium]|nr:hypothetical protein [Fimbriimonadaceae bacterium]